MRNCVMKGLIFAQSLVMAAAILLVLLAGCVSTVRFERKTDAGECRTTVTGTMPSFITPSAVAECRAEVK